MLSQKHFNTTPTISQVEITHFTDEEEAEYEAWLISQYESYFEDMGVPSIDSIAFAEERR
jgi:hypothetical protein